MKRFLIIAILFAFAIVPCFAEQANVYPYSVQGVNGISEPLKSYLVQSTADAELFRLSPDGQSWGVDFDGQRGLFDFIGICSYQNGTIAELNAMAKKRTYESRYSSGSTEPYVKGLPVHSGHFAKDGNETFIPFHYLIYHDGIEVEVFQNPLIRSTDGWMVNQVPWAMGNWTVNCHAITIALLGDGKPTKEQLKTLQMRIGILKTYNSNARVISRLPEGALPLDYFF